jgi:hypothetical protein
MRTLEVTFTAKFRTTIQVDNSNEVKVDDSDLADLLSDIDVPETEQIRYVEDSYEVCSVRQI